MASSFSEGERVRLFTLSLSESFQFFSVGVAVMQTRSRTVEMPSGLCLPLAFGIKTLLIGSGRF